MGRVARPSPFGMRTRRTGGALYRPDLKRSSSDRRFSSRLAAYSCAVCPSMPAAPSLRVTLYASRRKSTSMWWARLVNTIVGACLASSAIRRSFVETLSELGVSGIFLLNGSIIPVPPSLGRVSRAGFPCVIGTMRHSDSFPHPAALRFLRLAVPLLRRLFARSGQGRAARAPGFVARSPDRLRERRRRGLPGS